MYLLEGINQIVIDLYHTVETVPISMAFKEVEKENANKQSDYFEDFLYTFIFLLKLFVQKVCKKSEIHPPTIDQI